MTYETLACEVDDAGVATLTLSRPDQLNAFNVTMARELEQFFLTDATDDAIRAVVVTGAGRAFCAGMDLSADGNVFGLDESVAPDARGAPRAPRPRRRTTTGSATPAAA